MLSALGFLVTIASPMIAWSQEASAEVQDLLPQALQSYRQNEFKEALRLFKQVLDLEPNNAQAHFYTGIINLRNNRAEEGLRHIRRSAELAPRNARLRLSLGRAYEEAGQVDDAIDTYKRVMDMASGSDLADAANKRRRILIGKRLGDQGDFEEALKIFEDLAADHPNDPAVLQDLALSYFLLDRFDEAQEVFEKLLDLAPNTPPAHFYLAKIYEQRQQDTKAAEHYRQVLQMAPSNSSVARESQLKLSIINGMQYLAEKKPRQAIEAFQSALQISPNNVEALFNLATAYRDLDQLEQTRQALEQVLQQQPNHLEARLRLGAVLLELGELELGAQVLEELAERARGTRQAEQAGQVLGRFYRSRQGQEVQEKMLDERIARLERRVEDNPDDAAAHMRLGRIYQEQDKSDLAVEHLEHVVRLEPDNGEAHRRLAKLYEDSVRLDKAVSALSQAIGLTENSQQREALWEQLFIALAKKAFSENRLDEAERQFRDLAEQHPQDFVPHFYLAIIYTRQEELDKAVSHYQEVLDRVPQHYGARNNLGQVYLQMREPEKAITEFRRVLRSGPPPELEAQVQRRLETVQKRIRGFSYSLGYTASYDTNSNLDPDNPQPEQRSDLRGNIVYRHKLSGKDLTLGMNYSPTYSVYHEGHFDFLSHTLTPFLNGRLLGTDLSFSYSYTDRSSLMSEQDISTSQSLSGNGSWQFDMPALLPFMAGERERGEALTSAQIGIRIQDFASVATDVFDSYVYAVNANLSQRLGDGWGWNSSYSFNINDNKHAEGNDYAYHSHGLSLGLDKGWPGGLNSSVSYRATFYQYQNTDSVTNFQSFRRNLTQVLSSNLSYRLHNQMRVFARFSYRINNSNLPTRRRLTREQVQEGVDPQSSSLGDYEKQVISVGLSFDF